MAWPGALSQDYHRDSEAGTEAALLLFIPLDETSATEPSAAGPPELCACSHFPGSAEECLAGPTAVATDGLAPLGSVVVYDPGLGASGRPRSFRQPFIVLLYLT